MGILLVSVPPGRSTGVLVSTVLPLRRQQPELSQLPATLGSMKPLNKCHWYSLDPRRLANFSFLISECYSIFGAVESSRRLPLQSYRNKLQLEGYDF